MGLSLRALPRGTTVGLSTSRASSAGMLLRSTSSRLSRLVPPCPTLRCALTSMSPLLRFPGSEIIRALVVMAYRAKSCEQEVTTRSALPLPCSTM